MRVYVLNKKGKPLMPTTPRKARILLKEKKAIVVGREPFTIQLNYATGENKQNITLGIDAGYQTVGFSAITENQELISGEVELLKGISERLKERKMYRTKCHTLKNYKKSGFLYGWQPKLKSFKPETFMSTIR